MKTLAACALLLFVAGAATAQTAPAPVVPTMPAPVDSVRKATAPNADMQQGTVVSPTMTEPVPTKIKEKRKRTRMRTNPNFPE